MGTVISRTYTNEALTQSSVKLQAQSMPAFNGDPHKWQTWKKRARATIGSAGYLNVLDNQSYATRNRMKNETVFHLLQNATVEGHAAHLVDQFEPDRYGHSAYKALCGWYEGDKQTNATAEDIRAKLDRNFLSTKKSASQFINQFKTYNQQLRDLGEAYTKSKEVSLFLEKITDPDYENVVELCLAQDSTIEDCIQQVRAKERRLDRSNSKLRRKPLTIRRNVASDQDLTGEDEPIDKKEEFLTDKGYYSIPSHIWKKLTETEKTEVKSHNSALRKRRRRTDVGNDNSITTRRFPQSSMNTDHMEPPEKKQRTVKILEDEKEDQDDQETDLDDQKEIKFRRNGIMKFKVQKT